MIGSEVIGVRYTEQERAEQVATVRTLVSGGATHRQIQEATGLSLATIHERRREAAGLADLADLESATAVRREAGTTARSWLARIEDGYAAGAVDPLLASKEAHRWAAFLARVYGAFAPIRVDLTASVDAEVRPDPGAWEAITATLEDMAAEWSAEFVERWQLPDQAREELERKLRPWRPEHDDDPAGV